MLPQEPRIRVAGWSLQLRLDGEGARIRRQRLNRCHLRRIDVAFTAEIPGMAGSARGRHGAGSSSTGQAAVAFERETLRLVRLRNGELGHIRPGKPDCLGERHMAGRAGAVRGRQVGGPNAVAIETVLRHGQANLHSIGSRLGVTRPAVEQGIRASRATHRLDVIAVGEPQVGGWRSGWRPPADGFLDDPVVAVGTGGRLGPQCFCLVLYTGMTAGAFGKEIPVLPVIEAIL